MLALRQSKGGEVMRRVTARMIASGLLWWVGLVSVAAQPQTGPDGKPVRQVTSKDLGPDIDPKKLSGQPYAGIPLFRTFRSFMSSAYATANVWVYADGDDQETYDTAAAYTYPDFYTPTWGEMFD